MAHGGIVLASNVGGHRELIRDAEMGYLFPAGDVTALANAVLHVLSDRPGWPRIQTTARHFVERERSWALSAAAYEQVYRQALSAKTVKKVF